MERQSRGIEVGTAEFAIRRVLAFHRAKALFSPHSFYDILVNASLK